ncbi:MAG TPA: hypothetical protein DEQ30_06330 [Porphyromonadaceae bacterium]|nr:hypothetical protein [Porphyromonadaceae bacterium]
MAGNGIFFIFKQYFEFLKNDHVIVFREKQSECCLRMERCKKYQNRCIIIKKGYSFIEQPFLC